MKSQPSMRRVRSFDGVLLDTFSFGSKGHGAIAFVNALGMPLELIAPMAAVLAESHHVVTWNSRVSPGPGGVPLETRCDPAAHARDLEAVVDEYRLPDLAGLVCWCSGLSVAIPFLHTRPHSVGALVIVSPSGASLGAPTSSFEHQNRKLYEALLKRPERMNELLERVRGTLESDGAIQTSNPEAIRLAQQSFTSADRLLRHAALMRELHRQPLLEVHLDPELPVLALTGTDDEIVRPEVLDMLRRRLPHIVLERIEGGDHFLPYASPVAAAHIRTFIEARPRARRGEPESPWRDA